MLSMTCHSAYSTTNVRETDRFVEHGRVVVDVEHIDDEGAGSLQRGHSPVVGLDDDAELLLVVRLVPVEHLKWETGTQNSLIPVETVVLLGYFDKIYIPYSGVGGGGAQLA